MMLLFLVVLAAYHLLGIWWAVGLGIVLFLLERALDWYSDVPGPPPWDP